MTNKQFLKMTHSIYAMKKASAILSKARDLMKNEFPTRRFEKELSDAWYHVNRVIHNFESVCNDH